MHSSPAHVTINHTVGVRERDNSIEGLLNFGYKFSAESGPLILISINNIAHVRLSVGLNDQ